MPKYRLALFGILIALLIVGCNSESPTYPAMGTVVYKDTGEPITTGLTIWFESTTAPYQRSSGVVDKEGQFYTSTISDGSGSLAGEHRVRFDPGTGEGAATGPDALAPIMDRKYAEFSTSGLKVTVDPGAKNLFRLEVERGSQFRAAK